MKEPAVERAVPDPGAPPSARGAETRKATAVRDVLSREAEFAARSQATLLAWVDIAEPYHEFAGKFFKVAAEPTSPLSPFSPDSAPSRDESIDRLIRLTRIPGVRGVADDIAGLVRGLGS